MLPSGDAFAAFDVYECPRTKNQLKDGVLNVHERRRPGENGMEEVRGSIPLSSTM
jgi:hypothetical protein